MKPDRNAAEDWQLSYPLGSFALFQPSRYKRPFLCQIAAYRAPHGWPLLILEVISRITLVSTGQICYCFYGNRSRLQPVPPPLFPSEKPRNGRGGEALPPPPGSGGAG